MTPRTPNAFFSATAGYAAFAAPRTEESLPSLAPSEANSPERHGHGARHHPELPILLGVAAQESVSPSGPARVHFQAERGVLDKEAGARKIWTPSHAPHERRRVLKRLN